VVGPELGEIIGRRRGNLAPEVLFLSRGALLIIESAARGVFGGHPLALLPFFRIPAPAFGFLAALLLVLFTRAPRRSF
jgi:hypothetical protein